MENEKEKMMALKKVYADVILNAVKESAARVLVSERKCLDFQKDLCFVKDEALRMLIRLKNTLDSKMKEAEIASLCQRRKVEELEAQLHEAEDVIIDLRMQLKEAQYQLEKVKNDQMQPLGGKITNKISFSSKSTLEPNHFYPSTSQHQTVCSISKNMKIEPLKPCLKSFILSPCRTSINLVNDSMKSGKYHSNLIEQGNKLKQSTGLDSGFTLTKSSVNSTPVSSCVTTSVKALKRSRVVENAADSNQELMALPVNQESDATGNLIVRSHQSNSEMNINPKYENICEVTDSSPCQAEKKTSLNYTYTVQRKRKKEATDFSDENISPEKSNRKMKLVEKLKCKPEFKRSVLVRELSRESHQLSQVAHQLISLSGKRW